MQLVLILDQTTHQHELSWFWNQILMEEKDAPKGFGYVSNFFVGKWLLSVKSILGINVINSANFFYEKYIFCSTDKGRMYVPHQSPPFQPERVYPFFGWKFTPL